MLEDWGSDHLPLQTDVRLEHPCIQVHRRPRWSWKKARWDEYTGCVELCFEELGDKIIPPPDASPLDLSRERDERKAAGGAQSANLGDTLQLFHSVMSTSAW